MKIHPYLFIKGQGFPVRIASTVFLQTPKENIIIDSGDRRNLLKILGLLKALSLRPEDISHVITTHFHYDHCENNHIFRKAQFITSLREFESFYGIMENIDSAQAVEEILLSQYELLGSRQIDLIKNSIQENKDYWSSVCKKQQHFLLLKEETELFEGIKVIFTPGHSPGHMSVLVNDTLIGEQVIIAGDALQDFKWVERSEVSSHFICADVKLFLKSKQRIQALSGEIIPGHGTPFHLNGSSIKKIENKFNIPEERVDV